MRGGCGELVIRDCLVRRATLCKVGTQEKMLTGTTYLERFDDAQLELLLDGENSGMKNG